MMANQEDNQNPKPPIRQFRIFLASPSDVAEERQIAREVIEQVRGERAFRDCVALQSIAWDQPGVGVAMDAVMTPQKAIELGLPKPSECDLVVVIVWSRIGIPLPPDYETKPDGSTYSSGTEWEFQDAVTAAREHGQPAVWLYRRMEEPRVSIDDPGLQDKLQQRQSLTSFLNSLNNEDGSIAGGINEYQKSNDFRAAFAQHLRDWLTRITQQPSNLSPAPEANPAIFNIPFGSNKQFVGREGQLVRPNEPQNRNAVDDIKKGIQFYDLVRNLIINITPFVKHHTSIEKRSIDRISEDFLALSDFPW